MQNGPSLCAEKVRISINQLSLEYGGQEITNFNPVVKRTFMAPDDRGKIVAAEIAVKKSYNCVSVNVSVVRGNLLQQIKAADTSAITFGHEKRIEAYINELIYKTSPDAIYVDSIGLIQLYNGKRCYIAGRDVIGNAGEFPIVPSRTLSGIHLADDPNLNIEDAIRITAWRIIKYPGQIGITYFFTLNASVSSLIRGRGDISSTTYAALAIIGKQNFGKTALARNYCTLLNYDDGRPCFFHDADSTASGVRSAGNGERDVVVVHDDLSLNSDRTVQRDRARSAAETLRFYTNGSRRVANGKVEQTQASFAFTAEPGMFFTEPSEVSRTYLINLPDRIEEWDEHERAAAAITFREFMGWLLPRLEQSVEDLKKLLMMQPKTEDNRIHRNYAYLEWMASVFVRFLCETKILDEEKAKNYIKKLHNAFEQSKTSQLQRIKKATQLYPPGNLEWQILQLYIERRFHMVNDRKAIKDKYDCMMDKGATLIVSVTTLEQTINQIYPTQHLTSKQICKKLEEDGVIPPRDERSEKRSAGKRIRGHRFLAISFDLLKKKAIKY